MYKSCNLGGSPLQPCYIYQGTVSFIFQILLALLLGALLHLSGVNLGVLSVLGIAVMLTPKPFFSDPPSHVAELFALGPALGPAKGYTPPLPIVALCARSAAR
jgi:hypothetical protein